MNPATASSFSRGRDRARVDLLDRRQQQRPALDEELVEDLVLGVEVVVDEPVGDARLAGDVGDAAGVESPGGRRRGSPRRGSAGGGRPAVPWPSAAAPPPVGPAVGLGTAVGERRQRLADLAPAARGRARRSTKPSPSGGLREHHAPGVDDHRAPVGVVVRRRLAELVRRRSTKAWFSIARARSSTSQWSRPVSSVNAAGTVITRAPRDREDPVELGEAQVVTDA